MNTVSSYKNTCGRLMTEEEQKLIEGCIAGDPIAQKQLYLQYGPMIKGICMRYAGNRQQGEDLFHDVFIFILINFKKYTHISSLDGWLRRIAINKAVDYYRSAKRNSLISTEEMLTELQEQDEYDNIEIEETIPMAKLLEFINELSDKGRTAINLCLIDNIEQKEAAALMHETEVNLRTLLCRAKQKLRKRINKYMKDTPK